MNVEADGIDPATVAALEALGHEATFIEPRTPVMGWAQVIRRRSDGSYEGGADPRADSSGRRAPDANPEAGSSASVCSGSLVGSYRRGRSTRRAPFTHRRRLSEASVSIRLARRRRCGIRFA